MHKKFLFIDTTTKPLKSAAELNNCIYVSSISALTELNITITKALEKGKFEILIFDSLSTMLIYHNASTITKFVHNLIGKLRALNCGAVFTCVASDAKSTLVSQLSMLIDKRIRLEEKPEGIAEELKALYVDVLGPLGVEQFEKIEENLNIDIITQQIAKLKNLGILNEKEAEEFKNKVIKMLYG